MTTINVCLDGTHLRLDLNQVAVVNAFVEFAVRHLRPLMVTGWVGIGSHMQYSMGSILVITSHLLITQLMNIIEMTKRWVQRDLTDG